MRIVRWLLWRLYYRRKYRWLLELSFETGKWRRAVSGVTQERWQAGLKACGHRWREEDKP